MRNSAILSLLVLTVLFSCQQPATVIPDLTSEFVIEEGFKIEAVAAEPMLESLVAIDFDKKGRIWTVEMTGYMRDIDGADEKLPDGKISILEDTNGDGFMDKKKIFLDELVLPRAIAFINDGLLYAEPPNLWWVPIINDQPGERQLVDSLYANGGNVEHMPNGLLYNIDNWIYSAKSDRRYRFRNGKWEQEATASRGQWGISSDDAGHLYYNNNSNPIFSDYILPNQLEGNEYLAKGSLERQNLSKSRRFYPIAPTLINRGYQKGSFDSLGRVINFTSACSPLVYRGEQFSADYYHDAFVCGPEGNLVKRYNLVEEDGKTLAKATTTDSEFLVSYDSTFRPVNLNTGPDGALYVVDMRRAVIQHRAYMTSYLKELILERGQDKLPLGGRIYRVIDSKNEAISRPNLTALSNSEWIGLLQSKNAWKRTTAQKELIFKNNPDLTAAIIKVAKTENHILGQISALWTLEGLGKIDADLLNSIGTTTKNPTVLAQIILIAKTILTPENKAQLQPIFEKAATQNNIQVQLQLAHAIDKSGDPKMENIWMNLIKNHAENPLVAEALVSRINHKDANFLTNAPIDLKETALEKVFQKTMDNVAKDKKTIAVSYNGDQTDNRTRGFELYQYNCGTCHGMDGKGMENLAPPIYQSEYANGPIEHLALLILNGLEGPITVNGEIYEGAAVMPGIKNNPELTDKDINAILSFILSGFSTNSGWLNKNIVTDMRKQTADRQVPFTEAELKAWPIKKKD